MSERLEDFAEDVWAKALRGLGRSPEQLAESSGLPLERVKAVLGGEGDGEGIDRLAPRLGLHPGAMRNLTEEAEDDPPELPDGLKRFVTPYPVPGYEEMTVNAYLVWDAGTREAVAFDGGANADGMVRFLEESRLKLRYILLTHAHGDHVAGVAALLDHAGDAEVWLHEKERLPQATSFGAGKVWRTGRLQVESRLTPGHSPGGTTFVLRGMSTPVAMVGDALFCRSQGGVPASAYEAALAANRREIFGLPPETLLCPGHGPVTTVQAEKEKNPFYAKG